MEVVGRIREAVSSGLKVLDEAFTKLEVEDEASEEWFLPMILCVYLLLHAVYSPVTHELHELLIAFVH